jgi:hypothetical protein
MVPFFHLGRENLDPALDNTSAKGISSRHSQVAPFENNRSSPQRVEGF